MSLVKAKTSYPFAAVVLAGGSGTRFWPRSRRALAKQGVGIAVLDNQITRDDVPSGLLQRVLPEWNLQPIQVHAITETRLLPARTRLFIDFMKARLQAPLSA